MLEFHPDTVQYIRKAYGLDQPGRMEEAIDILDEWVKKQDHFVKKDFPRKYLETSIFTSKGSLEKAKARLDKLCTLKTFVPRFFGDFDLKNDFSEFDGIITQAMLPKLTTDHYRVLLQRTADYRFNNNIVLEYFRTVLIFCEYLKLHEYADGFIIIFDYFETDVVDLVTKVNITDLHQAITILVDGFGARLKSIHVLSKSKVINTLINTVKIVLPDKIKDRVHVHSSVEALHKYVEKDILPVEYGGEERSLNKLHNEWTDILSTDEFRSYLKDISQAGTDESRRSTDVFNTEYMGMPGTFRALKVD